MQIPGGILMPKFLLVSLRHLMPHLIFQPYQIWCPLTPGQTIS